MGQAAVLGNVAPKRFSLSCGHVWVCTAKNQVWELPLLQAMSTNSWVPGRASTNHSTGWICPFPWCLDLKAVATWVLALVAERSGSAAWHRADPSH